MKNFTTYFKDYRQTLANNITLRLIILLGFVSLFADMTYEAARSITGPFLATLGANAAAIGFIAGFGELLAYSLRLVSGYLIDKTARYWLIIFIGYGCNLVAVPLLATAQVWWFAALLIIIERMGKAIRTPARDALLSHASTHLGMGRGFGIHQGIDHIGGMLGPLLVTLILFFGGNYRFSFMVLGIPALIAMSILTITRQLYPKPQIFIEAQPDFPAQGIPRRFWLYLMAVAFIAAGYADYPLIAYHFEYADYISSIWIPAFYSFAMGVSAFSAWGLGRLYDRYGVIILMIVTFFAALFAPLVFLGNFSAVVVGMLLWGVGMGAQASLMKALVGTMIPPRLRGSAYGIFSTTFGVAWFLGSVLIGLLYDSSVIYVVIFSLSAQWIAIPILWIVRNGGKRRY